MKLQHYRQILVPIVVLFVIAAPLLATHSWGGYHWARTTPQFTLKLGDNLKTADWKSHLQQTSTDWNSPQKFGASSTPILTAIVAGQSNRRCSMVAGTTQVCDSTYGNNGWLGLASISLASGTLHITQGSAKMNDTYFNTATYNNPNERARDVPRSRTHFWPGSPVHGRQLSEHVHGLFLQYRLQCREYCQHHS